MTIQTFFEEYEWLTNPTTRHPNVRLKADTTGNIARRWVAVNGRPLGRGGVSRDQGSSPSTRAGCSRTGPAGAQSSERMVRADDQFLVRLKADTTVTTHEVRILLRCRMAGRRVATRRLRWRTATSARIRPAAAPSTRAANGASTAVKRARGKETRSSSAATVTTRVVSKSTPRQCGTRRAVTFRS
jgi:hypothetical protein